MTPTHGHLRLLILALPGLLLVLSQTVWAASNTVPTSNNGTAISAIGPNDVKPPECTMTVTSILTGSGTFSATAQNQLVLGSPSADTVSLQKNDCFVGGGPTSGSLDRVTGTTPASSNGDQCIVTAGATTIRCTVVAMRP
jgi:hypothetical protein